MVVYFIQRESDGAIKIGFSNKIKSRVANLKSTEEENLKILGIFEGDREKEKELHERFKDLRKHKEWFAPGSAILDYLSATENASMSLADFPSGKIMISIHTTTYQWLKQQIEYKRFRSMSHGAEFAISELMKREEMKA